MQSSLKLAFHDADTDTDILARIVARMSACRSACHRNNFNRACRTSRGCPCRCRRRGIPPLYSTMGNWRDALRHVVARFSRRQLIRVSAATWVGHCLVEAFIPGEGDAAQR